MLIDGTDLYMVYANFIQSAYTKCYSFFFNTLIYVWPLQAGMGKYSYVKCYVAQQ